MGEIEVKSRKLVAGILGFSAIISFSFAVGCRDSRTENDPRIYRVVEDDLGRAVRLPDRVDRAIALAPSLTEMTFAAGAGDRLVGVTTYCNFPTETATISKVGDTQSPNVEKIVALQPQVVLVSTASQLESFMSVLAEQNIAVYVLDVRGIDDVPTGLRKLGGIFGTTDASEKAAEELEKRLKTLSDVGATKPRPSVFLQISKEPLFTIGKDSFLTELIQRAGGVSVTKDVASGYPKLSKETALAMNPDVLILSDSEDNREPNEVFKNSSAVKNRRVYKIDADTISRPGPRLVDALEEIGKILLNK